MATLEWIDAGEKGRWLAVKEVSVGDSQAVKRSIFYPVCRSTESEARDCYDLGTELRAWGEGRYTLYLPSGRQISVHLCDGVRTLPVAVEEEPIPCPKVRAGTKVRWNGGWQKWTKTKGWVVA